MSHVPQRKEKDCLNCGSTVLGRYCQVCGQENVIPKETFWHMVTHFFYDVTHFDSSFFTTVKDLILRPAFLSKEYIAGRRSSYLHPIRMYVFTSAIFFLIILKFTNINKGLAEGMDKPIDSAQRVQFIQRLEQRLKEDSTGEQLKDILKKAKDTSKILLQKDMVEGNGGISFAFSSGKIHTVEAYDSAQRSLPKDQRDDWFTRRLTRKAYDINERYKENPKEALEKLQENVLHRLPYMLFVSLPLFAFILKILYIRRRKTFYYADHGIFTIHIYVFTFLVLLMVFATIKLGNLLHRDFGWANFALFLWLYIYLYKAMRNFYGQRRAKTIFKFLMLSLSSFIMVAVLFAIFLFFSAYTL